MTFETRSSEHVSAAAGLDLEEVLAALKKAGIDAFPAYGTLLGAVRDGKLIGHDSDADIGYVSRHEHPARRGPRVVRAAAPAGRAGLFDQPLQRRRLQGDVHEADGSLRGLDVFGGFLAGLPVADGRDPDAVQGRLDLPARHHHVRGAGRFRPRPGPTGSLLRRMAELAVPDPAFHFETPGSTYRRLDGWFRGTRAAARLGPEYHGQANNQPAAAERAGATFLEAGARGRVAGRRRCGRGSDALWFARQGRHAMGLDFARGFENAAPQADEQADLDVSRRTCWSCGTSSPGAPGSLRCPAPAR